MDTLAHFASLTRELEALRDRVRNFCDDPHWQTDGEWKESVLRATLRAHLPAHIEPLRGFVVGSDRCSGQIDVLLYDNTKPVLFRNGDLVFVTADAVVGIVEVKSRIRDRHGLREALRSVAEDAELIRERSTVDRDLFVGLFAYQTELDDGDSENVLTELQVVSEGTPSRIVSYFCLGCSHFGMFWESDPENRGIGRYDTWHFYSLPDLAAGYFINNLVHAVAEESVAGNLSIWFPETSKELRRLGRAAFQVARPQGNSSSPAASRRPSSPRRS